MQTCMHTYMHTYMQTYIHTWHTYKTYTSATLTNWQTNIQTYRQTARHTNGQKPRQTFIHCFVQFRLKPRWFTYLTTHFRYRVAKTHRMPYLLRSFSTKEPYNLWLCCEKMTCNLRHPMGLRHPVSNNSIQIEVGLDLFWPCNSDIHTLYGSIQIESKTG